jgi:hypothetical protein
MFLLVANMPEGIMQGHNNFIEERTRANAHLALGMLYQKRRQDRHRAVGHFRAAADNSSGHCWEAKVFLGEALLSWEYVEGGVMTNAPEERKREGARYLKQALREFEQLGAAVHGVTGVNADGIDPFQQTPEFYEPYRRDAHEKLYHFYLGAHPARKGNARTAAKHLRAATALGFVEEDWESGTLILTHPVIQIRYKAKRLLQGTLSDLELSDDE